METEPVDRIEDHQSGETPEDVAILYSWANLQGAKYRDFSANRREYRAQMRHRAAEQLRLMELKAQSEAEAAAAEAEAEAAAAHAEADAATVRLAASRSMPGIQPQTTQAEEEVEHQRRSSLREASQQARRAAAERLEAARRAESAALADSIARREEREIAEAQASALRQAAQYADSDLRNRHSNGGLSDNAIPGRISDPYSPQILAEGEYFENPGTPITELVASRFRSQREYIERSTGAELPPFRMPSGYSEGRGHDRPLRAEGDRGERSQPEWFDEDDRMAREGDFSPRKLADIPRGDRDIRTQGDDLARRGREARNFGLPVRPAARETPRAAANEARGPIPFAPYSQPGSNGDGVPQRRPEVVNRIPDTEGGFLYRVDDADYREGVQDAEPTGGRGASQEDPYGWPEEQGRDRKTGRGTAPFDGYPGTNLGYMSPHAASEPLYRPEVDPPRPPQRGTEQVGGPSHSPRPPFTEEQWGDVPGQPPPRSAGPVRSQPSDDSAPELRNGFRGAEPEWLGPKAGDWGEQKSAPPGAPKLREERSGAGGTLQSSREQLASRWFALKEVFAHRASDHPPAPQVARETKRKAPVIAVFSMAGGVGKTSLVATLGRTLSSLGEKVLLADSTSHGLLPFYFGASEIVPGVVRTFLPPSGSTDAPIHLVSYNTGSESDTRSRAKLVEGLVEDSHRAHRVLMDLDVNCRWLIERLGVLQPMVLVPVSADMNSIISLQTMERSFSTMQNAEGEPLRPLYVLNQFDASLPLHLDVREVLRQQLGDRLLPIVIRRARGVSEALAEGMTIVDYDPESIAAQDYLGLANWIRARSAPSRVGVRDLRWSER